jgi:hypothetical protein
VNKICTILAAVTVTSLVGSPATATPLFLQDFNSSNGGFTSAGSAIAPWTYNSSGGCWSTDGRQACSSPFSETLTSPTVTVSYADQLTLTFDHRYSFEVDQTVRWDGGQVRISINGGAFSAVPDTSFSANGYDGIIGGNGDLNGQEAFNGNSPGYSTPAFIRSIANLGNFNVGDTLAIQFIAGFDECARGLVPNWEIDLVQISDQRSVAEPTTLALFGLGLAGLGAMRRKKLDG